MHKTVHVIHVDRDSDSILESVKEVGHPIQKAYLVLRDSDGAQPSKTADELEGNLKVLVDVERIAVTLEVYGAAQEMLKAIKREKDEGNTVLINATGSSPLTAMPSCIAAQLSCSKLYWKRDSKTGAEELPLPKTKEISRHRLTIIKTLQDNGGNVKSVRDLIELTEGVSTNEKDYMGQRARLNHYLKDLENDGLVETERTGKEVEIRLTELGRAYAVIG